MKIISLILTYLFAAIMLLAGIAHLIKPAPYAGLVPGFLPTYAVIYVSGVFEIGIGLGIFIPRFRSISSFVLFILMIAYLPIHLWDALKLHPAIGSHTIAYIRLPIQFVLIGWAWFIYKNTKYVY